MGFLTSIFGNGESNIWTVVFALAVVLVLIVAGVWALKLVFRASGSIARGRQRRLAIIDSMAIDPKRQLVLIRRDDVEHLIITGSSGDLVVETGIPVPAPEPRSASHNQGELFEGRKQPTLERATAAAQRLGLSNILRRKNSGKKQDKVRNADENKSVESGQKLEPTNGEHQPRSLRHTGLLRPVSEMESVDFGSRQDNFGSENNDSVMNKAHKVDIKAKKSVEEGATPKAAGAEVKTHNDNQEASNKKG